MVSQEMAFRIMETGFRGMDLTGCHISFGWGHDKQVFWLTKEVWMTGVLSHKFTHYIPRYFPKMLIFVWNHVAVNIFENQYHDLMMNIIVFGPPGSGKGTQSVKIAGKYHLAHISTGDIFRSEIRNKTKMGNKVQSYISKGELVPDELLLDILKNAMEKHSGTRGYVFDGFPRTIHQAVSLDKLMQEKNQEITLVLALEVSGEEVVKRLLKRAQLEGRSDDNEEVIRNRLKVYHEQTEPLLTYYDEQDKLATVPGEGTIEGIFKNLCRAIEGDSAG